MNMFHPLPHYCPKGPVNASDPTHSAITIRRSDSDAEIPVRVVDVFVVDGDSNVKTPAQRTADDGPSVSVEFATGDLADVRTVVIRGDVSGCVCEIGDRRFTLEEAGGVHVVDVSRVDNVPRIPGKPTIARYLVVRRSDRTLLPVALSAVHIRSTDYREPWPVHARMRPAGKRGAVAALLDYSDYSVCETPRHRQAAIELDYGADVPVFAITLLTNASIKGCVVELLREDDRTIVFQQEVTNPSSVQVIHTASV
jgi:hypothetical protein